MMASKIKPFNTHTLDVKWGHLHAPDDKFGEDSSNHSVTVVVDKELQKTLDQVMSEAGATKINGMKTDDEGITLLKAKSKTFVKKGTKVFPCRDAQAEVTEACPFQGDKVRLRLSPIMLTRDGSLSFFLNGCQIIEKNEMDTTSGTGGFESTKGFDGSSWTAPTSTEEEEATDDIPF
jgi:hypothetical protein